MLAPEGNSRFPWHWPALPEIVVSAQAVTAYAGIGIGDLAAANNNNKRRVESASLSLPEGERLFVVLYGLSMTGALCPLCDRKNRWDDPSLADAPVDTEDICFPCSEGRVWAILEYENIEEGTERVSRVDDEFPPTVTRGKRVYRLVSTDRNIGTYRRDDR